MKATKKTFIMFLVVVLLAVSMPVNGLETVNAAEAAHLIINQVYGGGGKSEPPIMGMPLCHYQEMILLNRVHLILS